MCDGLSACVQGTCITRTCVGVPCANGKHCDNGACFCDDTSKADCGSSCADLMSDPLNCGLCGNVCGMGTSCSGGACLATGCSGGKRVCGGMCTDPQTDPDNCGSCGNACGGGRVCVGGACQCPSGLAFCGAACVNLQNDIGNCGTCGRSCNGGTCQGGICQCAAGQQLCNGTCKNVQLDTSNCGVCGRTCTPDQACVSGTCTCGPGTTLCNGSCINTSNDNINCGGCGVTCPASSFCNGSACTPAFTCQTSFTAAPADCPAFPLSAAACGQQALTNTVPWMGSANAAVTNPIPRNAGQEFRIEGTTAVGSTTFTFENTSTSIVAQLGQGCCCNACGENWDFRTTGSVYACANPVDVILSPQTAGTYSLNVEYWTFSGKYNTGGNAAAAPTDFAKDPTSGRVCDQVCGDVKNTCGDNAEYYRLVLPAHKAVVLQMTFSTRGGTSAFNLNVLDMAGAGVCPLVSNGSANTVPTAYKARLVNNTNADQPVVIAPTTLNTNLTWNMAVGVEP
jgi:hypothetical protein